MIKRQLKIKDSLYWDKLSKEQQDETAKRARTEGLKALKAAMPPEKGNEISVEGKACQEKALLGWYSGTQQCLGLHAMGEEQLVRQRKKAEEVMQVQEKTYWRYFYALDTETTGFTKN